MVLILLTPFNSLVLEPMATSTAAMMSCYLLERSVF
jgi:hypothetical protein